MNGDDPIGASEAIPPRAGRRRTDAPRLKRPAGWLLFGIALAFVTAIIFAGLLTQTNWGRSQILAYTVRTLGGRLSGELSIGRVEGNMITGARLYDVGLRGYDGVPLAVLDSAYIQYRVVTFLGGDIVINRLAVWNADINLLKMPGDTAWNYQEILTDPTPDPNAPPGATLIERLVMNDSRIVLRGPISGDPRLSPERRQLEIDRIIADTSQWYIQEVPGGHIRGTYVDVDSATLAEVFIGGSRRGGIYAEALQLHADYRGSRNPPLEIRDAVGQLHLHEGLINLQAQRFELPNSRGEMVGAVDMSGDRPMFDLAIEAPEYALSDMRWLFPWFPDDPEAGRGSGRFWLQDRPDDLLFLARDFDFNAPGTRVTGEFGLITTIDGVRFANVDLVADPLDMDAIDPLLPEGLPVSGLEITSAEVQGE
jgi:hypothetical protein